MVYWLYQLDQQTTSFPPIMDSAKPVLSSYYMKTRTDTQPLKIWHRHINKKYLNKLRFLSEGMEFGEPRKYKFDCEDCVKATQRRQISRFPTALAQECLEDTEVHEDHHLYCFPNAYHRQPQTGFLGPGCPMCKLPAKQDTNKRLL